MVLEQRSGYMITQLPTTLHARKVLATQMLTNKHPAWTWLQRIAAISKAHARLEAGVTLGRVLAAERKDWERRI